MFFHLAGQVELLVSEIYFRFDFGGDLWGNFGDFWAIFEDFDFRGTSVATLKEFLNRHFPSCFDSASFLY